MATYTYLSSKWTTSLNAFAMMRLGASVADQMPLMIGRRVDDIKELDHIPGRIGDGTGSETIGQLELSGLTELKFRRCRCYEWDNEPSRTTR